MQCLLSILFYAFETYLMVGDHNMCQTCNNTKLGISLLKEARMFNVLIFK